MIYRIRLPEPPLSSFVESISYFEGYQPAHDREVLIPDGSVFIIIDPSERGKRLFGGPFSAAYSEFREAWISGLQQGPITIEAQTGAALLVIKFVPGGAGAALQLKVSDLTDKVLPLDQVLDGDGGRLRAGIIAAHEAEAKITFAEGWLRDKIGGRARFAPVLAAMIALLRDQPGIGVARMAEAIGYSERHARNLFRVGMGVNPKQFARILRFQSLLKHLAASGGEGAKDPMLESGSIPSPNWADVAHAFGYADQAHMNIEFRALSGFTPGGYVAAYRGMENFLPVSLPKL